MERLLTQNRDVDKSILERLDDTSLFNFCLSNTYASSLCKDDGFWHRRFLKKYGEIAAKYKPVKRTWRNHYLKVVADLDTYVKEPWNFFNVVSWNLLNDNIDSVGDKKYPDGTEDETYHNNFWMLNLGKTITLEFPVDRYNSLDNITREYTSDEEYTPFKVLTLIKDFYNEPITVDELLEQQEEDSPYADDYTEEDVENGKVTRLDMLGSAYFEGFTTYENTHILNLGF